VRIEQSLIMCWDYTYVYICTHQEKLKHSIMKCPQRLDEGECDMGPIPMPKDYPLSYKCKGCQEEEEERQESLRNEQAGGSDGSAS
jgi:hypothetical protein